MKKTLFAVCIGLLSAGAVQADTVTQILDQPPAGALMDGDTVTTMFTDASGASFDIVYTLGTTSNSTTSQPNSSGGAFGVLSTPLAGTDTDGDGIADGNGDANIDPRQYVRWGSG